MTQKELLYVKTVADEKSISKAAKRLFMAQPSLSQSIRRIEDSLGTPLFNRTTVGLSLTYAGERYYHAASKILKIYEDFEIEISDINDLKTGRVQLGTTNHLGTLVLPQILPRFLSLCPHVELTISEETTQTVEQNLLSGQIDFALMHAPKEQTKPQIEYEVLTHDPFVIVLATDHPLLDRAVKKLGRPFPVLDLHLLKNESFLMLQQPQRIRQVTDVILAKAGIYQPQIRFTLRNYDTVQMLAAQGLGVTLLPLQYTGIAVSGRQPAFCSIDEKYDASWDTCIATLKDNFLSRADQLFIRIARDYFNEQQETV